MGKQQKEKINIPICVAGVLLCLTLISFYLCGGLYAKYSSGSVGGDSARVITFGDLTLTESGDFGADGQGMIVPGVDLTKKAVVKFTGSEAATYVFIEVAAAGWQTADNYAFAVYSGEKVLMQWSVAQDWSYLKNNGGTYVYYCALDPNTPLDQADIIAADGNIAVSEYITRSELQALASVSIKLRASVVQSNGFEGPVAAWNSIAAKEEA